MLLVSEFWYPIFLHFRLEYVILSHPAKFQLITTTGSVFFWTVLIEILRPPLLTLVPEAYARISGSYVIGSPQTFTWRLAVWKLTVLEGRFLSQVVVVRLRPRLHGRGFICKRIAFDAVTPSVYTAPIKTVTETESF